MSSRLLVLVLLAFAMSACATKSLHLQSWQTMQSPNFELFSTLGSQETIRVAADLERFRAAVQFIDGTSQRTAPKRTRVFAFDGRALIRPFDVRAQSSYLLPSPTGNVIVLRTGGGFGDASRVLREELAHHVLREARGFETPLWYEEGVAQLLGTAEVQGRIVQVGIVNDELVLQLRDHDWMDIDTLLQIESLDGRGERRRLNYSSEAWVMLHYLFFGQKLPQQVQKHLGRIVSAWVQAPWEPLSVQKLFRVTPDSLEHALQRYARRDRFRVMEMRIGDWREVGDSARAPRALAPSEAQQWLGWLSMQLRRGEQARSYFEMALANDPGSPRVLAGLATAHSLSSEWDAATERLDAALAIAPEDASVQLDAGDVYRRYAIETEDAELRRSRLERARSHYLRAGELDPDSAGPPAAYGLSYLVDGEDAALAIEPLSLARSREPESLEATLWLAEAQARLGRRASPSRLARDVLSRTHHARTRDAAQELLDWVGDPRPGNEPWVLASDEAPWAR